MTVRLQGIGSNGDQHVTTFINMLAACLRLEVFADANGNLRRAAGPPAPAQLPFTDMFDRLTGHTEELTIRVGSGQNDVIGDRYDRREMDVGDLGQYPETPPANKPQLMTRCELLIHILAEYLHALDSGRTTGRRGFSDAHRAGQRAQGRHRAANGQGGRVTSQRGNRARTRGTTRYSNGARTTTVIENGNVTDVR